MKCHVYIMANPFTKVLYTGMTSNLVYRVWQHKDKSLPGFTSKYNVTSLVYYQECDGPKAAIAREKQIKGRSRAKKIALIESANLEWDDLSSRWLDMRAEVSVVDHGVPVQVADSSVPSE